MVKRVFVLFIGLINKCIGRCIFVNHYSGHLNVGDLLHEDIIKFYCKKKSIKIPGVEMFEHYLLIGSVIDKMNSKSTVIGSGANSEERIKDLKEMGNILSVRGHKTKLLIENHFQCEINVLLGDLAVLYPDVYMPKVKTEYKYGLVLHYVDENHAIKDIAMFNNVNIISVRQKPKDFVKDLLACELIISSSMHGCILSDAYGIKNKRITLSDNITGADLKFSDYYSTTDNPNETALFISDDPNWDDLYTAYSLCSVKKFIYSKEEIKRLLLELK